MRKQLWGIHHDWMVIYYSNPLQPLPLPEAALLRPSFLKRQGLGIGRRWVLGWPSPHFGVSAHLATLLSAHAIAPFAWRRDDDPTVAGGHRPRFDARAWLGPEGIRDERLRSTGTAPDGERDWVHGSPYYYDLLAGALAARYLGETADDRAHAAG